MYRLHFCSCCSNYWNWCQSHQLRYYNNIIGLCAINCTVLILYRSKLTCTAKGLPCMAVTCPLPLWGL